MIEAIEAYAEQQAEDLQVLGARMVAEPDDRKREELHRIYYGIEGAWLAAQHILEILKEE